MKYAVVYEQTPRNWAAYVPDLPGCVATGATREEVEAHRAFREEWELYAERTPRFIPRFGQRAEDRPSTDARRRLLS